MFELTFTLREEGEKREKKSLYKSSWTRPQLNEHQVQKLGKYRGHKMSTVSYLNDRASTDYVHVDNILISFKFIYTGESLESKLSFSRLQKEHVQKV